MRDHEKYQAAVADLSGAMRDAIKANMPSPPSNPDSIENLVATLANMIRDNKDAIKTLRADYLGPWPEDGSKLIDAETTYNTDGLIGQLRSVLYNCLDNSREIRDHIAIISKGVR